MSNETLKIISDAMTDLGLNYAFMEWQGEVVYPYFVGEYQESPPLNEDGLQESVFILAGFTRKTWLELEEAKDKIKTHFNKVSGKTVIADSGSAVAIFYDRSLVTPTGDAELKKIEIYLSIKEWSVK